jgi:hypothetical protein
MKRCKKKIIEKSIRTKNKVLFKNNTKAKTKIQEKNLWMAGII